MIYFSEVLKPKKMFHNESLSMNDIIASDVVMALGILGIITIIVIPLSFICRNIYRKYIIKHSYIELQTFKGSNVAIYNVLDN